MKAPSRVTVPITVGVIGVLVAGCGIAVGPQTQHEEHTYEMSGINTVEVAAHTGRVEVVGADTAAVSVQELLSYSNEHNRPKPERPVTNGVLSLRFRCPSGFTLGTRSCGVSYQVTVPRGTAVRVRTDTGSIRLAGLAGTVRADTDVGRVVAKDIRGPQLDVVTSVGSIQATDLRTPRLTARSDSGSLDLDWSGAPEQVTAETDVGSIRLLLPDVAYAVTATTDNGAKQIGVIQDPAASRHITARTDSGSITVSR